MQILRTNGIKSNGWGGSIKCITKPHYLPELMFRYMPKASIKSLTFIPEYVTAFRYNDMPIGMSADACIQYWEDL